MANSDYEPEDGKQIPARPHDSGSQANETSDGLNAEAEELRRAAESVQTKPDIDKVPVFDRADLPPKI